MIVPDFFFMKEENSSPRRQFFNKFFYQVLKECQLVTKQKETVKIRLNFWILLFKKFVQNLSSDHCLFYGYNPPSIKK